MGTPLKIRDLAIAAETSEYEIIRRALENANTIDEAAHELGVTRQAVYKWIASNGYRVEWQKVFTLIKENGGNS